MLKGKFCQRVWQCTHSVSDRFLRRSPSPGLILPFNWGLCQRMWQVSSELSGSARVCFSVCDKSTKRADDHTHTAVRQFWVHIFYIIYNKNAAECVLMVGFFFSVMHISTMFLWCSYSNVCAWSIRQEKLFIGQLCRHVDQKMTVSVLGDFLCFR